MTENDDAEFGFIWGVADGDYFLRTPDRQYRSASEHVVETLREKADEMPLSQVIDETAAEQEAAADVLREMHEDGYLREDAPVERMVAPEDIRIWPRAILTGLLYLLGGWLFLETFFALDRNSLYSLGTSTLVTAAIVVGSFLSTFVIHEYGHYRTAIQEEIDAVFDVSVVNGIIPAVITRTNNSWALPRNRRMWITLAGPVYGLLFSLALFGLYHGWLQEPGLAIGGILAYNIQVTAINPIIHGDGYFLIIDITGKHNIRTEGIADVKERRLTWSSVYVVGSYGLIIGRYVLSLLFAYFVADYWGVGAMVSILAVAMTIRLVQSDTVRTQASEYL